MNKLKIVILSILFALGFTTSESSKILDDGKFEIGIFQPLRWGYSKNMEISTHPILFFTMPNGSVKIKHDTWGISSRHRFVYPTPLMRMFQKPGMFGLITPEADVGKVPHIFVFQNEIYKSISVNNSIITFKGGHTFAIVSDELDDRFSLDLPLIYPRMGEFFNGYKINIGADLRTHITNSISLLIDGDMFKIPNEEFFYESKLIGEYKVNKSWKILAGTKFTYGQYPYGKQTRLFPLFDVMYSWTK